jgi:hypothetical protein
MHIRDFISGYKNHPVLFIGTGFSLRYLKTSFSWESLLSHISFSLTNNEEFFLDLKSECNIGGEYRYDLLASKLEVEFNSRLAQDRNGFFKQTNDVFYEKMKEGIKLSRFKIYITSLLNALDTRDEKKDEISSLIKARKNIGSIITTNYDQLIENIFQFNPLVGNNILLSNPYGSVYKIHGCISNPANIIMTEQDYQDFDNKYELIRAQLLSLFIHNPIIFIGYSISDTNIKSILKTVFSYVDPKSELAKQIRDNFLLIEYESGSNSFEIVEHDIDLEGMATIRINKIKTNNYTELYNSLSDLKLPVSAMDIRKVQDVWTTIKSGGEIKVKITENLSELSNDQLVIAVGSEKTVRYEYQTKAEFISNYFQIIEEANGQLIETLNKQTISSTEHFPVYAFSSLCNNIDDIDKYKHRQLDKILSQMSRVKAVSKCGYNNINDVIINETSIDRITNILIFLAWDNTISLMELKEYLIHIQEKTTTDYRRLLCLYDYLSY